MNNIKYNEDRLVELVLKRFKAELDRLGVKINK
jgi:ribosomal protein S21